MVKRMHKKAYTLVYYKRDRKTHYGLNTFLYTVILSSLLIIPIVIYDKGYFLYYGDFNVQQIPFYKLAHDSILSGNISWNHLTDLGVNFIGSYSFYLLGSPFFYLTLLFPSEAVPYLIGPLLVLKLSLCALSAYIFLRHYVRNKNLAVLGGIMYAFSGFSIYNIFFFHFHEPMIILPLLLAAVDEFMLKKRRGVVALCVFAAAFVNYYFFFGEAVFLAIYFVIRLVSHSYEFKLKEFFLLILECVLGVLMSCVLLIPSILAIISNSRVSSIIMGMESLVYKPSQRYLHILSSLFFPPDIPARPNFTPESASKWASVAAYLPMFSMLFVISFVKTKRQTWIKRLFIFLIVMAFIPILNSMFQAFNSVYYARWFYMLTLIMILMTVISLETMKRSQIRSALYWTALFTLGIALPIGLLPYEKYTLNDVTYYGFGLEKSRFRFWAYVAIAVGGIILTLLILRYTKKKPKLMIRVFTVAMCVFCLGYGEFILWQGKSNTDHTDEFVIENALNYGENISLEDVREVRNDFINSMDNIAMYWQVPSINAFHSIVPASIMEFYDAIGVERLVGSRPEPKYYGIRSLLSVKYYFIQDQMISDKDKDDRSLMPDFDYIGCENGFDEYENRNYIPMGFMYDNYICDKEFLNLSEDTKHLAMLKALVLTKEQMEKYRDITGYTDGMYNSLTYDASKPQNVDYPKYENYEPLTDSFKYDNDTYRSDCEKLKENSCESFEYTDDGFVAVIDNKGDDNILFFSVPYDEGFTAYIDGKETNIEKVNIGFCGIRVDGHKKSEIRFVYTTPGLKTGMYVSAGAILIFIVYMIIAKGFKAKIKYRRAYRIKK